MKIAEGRSSTLPFFSTPEELSATFKLSPGERDRIRQVSAKYPLRVPRFYAALMDPANPSCPIRRQAVPSAAELEGGGLEDPFGEQEGELAPAFVKRYSGRGVLLVSGQCAMYCRFCNRKRFVGRPARWEGPTEETFLYLRRARDVSEVILSGGDPLMLPAEEFASTLGRLRSIDHIRTLRISSRLPVVCPPLVTEDHIRAVRDHGAVWLIIHINHPREVTPEFLDLASRFRRAGAILLSQTVLLRGVNDCAHVLSGLFTALVSAGVKPYYLFQLDEVKGAGHFKVRIRDGVEIMRRLRGMVSGLAMPQYALDITGGLGKVVLDHRYVKRREGKLLRVESPTGKQGSYTDDGERSTCTACGLCGKSTFNG